MANRRKPVQLKGRLDGGPLGDGAGLFRLRQQLRRCVICHHLVLTKNHEPVLLGTKGVKQIYCCDLLECNK